VPTVGKDGRGYNAWVLGSRPVDAAGENGQRMKPGRRTCAANRPGSSSRWFLAEGRPT